MPAGQIDVPPAITSSSADVVTILVRGVGTHGAAPHLGVDPVLIAAQTVVSIQSMVGRDINPIENAVISVGRINGGVKSNIIPEQVELQMTVRADNPATRERLLNGIDRVARGTALTFGVPEDRLPIVTRSVTETTPATINDGPTAARIRSAIGDRMGQDRLINHPRAGMGAEDFAYYITPDTGVRGVYFIVGGTPSTELASAPGHHSPLFRVSQEPAVTAGVEAMVVAAETLMARPQS
jgi:hippurate hydrolase